MDATAHLLESCTNATTKPKCIELHVVGSAIFIQEPSRVKLVRIRVDAFISMNCPEVGHNGRTGWDEVTFIHIVLRGTVRNTLFQYMLRQKPSQNTYTDDSQVGKLASIARLLLRWHSRKAGKEDLRW